MNTTPPRRVPHVLVCVGTRPECIKLAPLVQRLRAHDGARVSVCLTSQHREMLQQALAAFDIDIDADLDVMTHGQHLIDLQARIMQRARPVMEQLQPDWVVVQGDTTTALACALAATWLGIRVAHVEAGLRTGNRHSPWPEELNRSLISRVAELHFAPTEANAAQLRDEKVDGAIHVVGNTVIDALLAMRERLQTRQQLRSNIQTRLADDGFIDRQHPLMLVTGHRRESFGTGFSQICDALATLAQQHPELDIVYAVHMNPQVHDVVHGRLAHLENITLLPPQDYASFVYLMDRSHLILSDSGGIQEEAPSLDKPVLVMRDTTERQEAVDSGAVQLVGTDAARIVASVNDLLHNPDNHARMAAAANPFGDGEASSRIATLLVAQQAVSGTPEAQACLS